MKKTVKSNKAMALKSGVVRKLIRSANDDEVIDDETDEFASEDSDDSEDEEETDGFDMDEEIVDEINDNDDFGGEELSKEDIIEAIKVIDEIATAITETSGEDVSIDAETVLNKVEEFAEDSSKDSDIDNLDFGEDIPDELANSVVRVMVQDENNADVDVSTGGEIYTDIVEDTPATVYDSDMQSEDVEFDGDEDEEAEDDELLVVGNSKSNSFKKGVIKLTSNLARKNPIAWKKAYTQVKSSLKKSKKKVMSASDWALVKVLAQAYNKDLSNKIVTVKRVVSAIKKSSKLTKMLQSEIDFENKVQDTLEGAPESEMTIKDKVGGQSMNIDENVGDNQSGEIDSQSGDPTISLTTEEEKEGEILDEPCGTIEELSLPIGNSMKKIAFRKVGANTFVGCGYKNSTEKKCVRLVKSSYKNIKGFKDDKALTNALDGMVVKFKDGTAMLLKSSNLFGLMACHAPFAQGEKKSKYDVFKKIGSSFVSSKGTTIKSSLKTNYVIASCGNATKCKTASNDVFASLEKDLYRRSILACTIKSNMNARKNNKTSVLSSKNEYTKKINILSSMLRKRDAEIKRLSKLASGTEAEIRSQIAERDRENLFASSQRKMSEETSAIKSNAEHNVNHMAKLMGSIFG